MKNFLLLLGTQKCGTTWLSNQLNLHPEFQSCKIKEWRSIGKATEFSQNSKDKCPKLFFLKQEFWFSLNTKQKRMFASANLNNYLSILKSSLLWDKNKNCVGDITGANGLIKTESLLFFKYKVEEVGFKIKPIYIMRDPCERHLAASKMSFQGKVLKKDNLIFKEEKHSDQLIEFSLNLLNEKRVKDRTKYEIIIPKIETIFKKNKILYLFAEDLRKDKAIDIITDFLGLKRFDSKGMPGYQLTSSNNESTINYDFSFEIKNKLHSFFAETYFFVYDKFGDRVPKSWKNS